MIDGSKKRNCQLAFELQNSHVCEECSLVSWVVGVGKCRGYRKNK